MRIGRSRYRLATSADSERERWDWSRGPHERFAATDVARLACDSLDWFESSPESTQWRGDATARLELAYPSGAVTVHASYDARSELSWEGQLRTWFERLPADEVAREDDEEDEVTHPWAWTVRFDDRGEVSGAADADVAALDQVRAALVALGPSPLFAQPQFTLAYLVRPEPYVMNSYGADVDTVDRLDTLPDLVRAKIAEYAR